ncbi:hypothetical protein DFH06DRAFT_1221670 [Mycena polygramma]|nr:hypothetical protein DFH06DRAFT_1221670 [Mycena polygramma]
MVFHQFIDCPTPNCPERIPAVLVCSGQFNPHNADLEYQVCSVCKHFKWLDPEAAAAAERRARDAPADGAPPYPPPDPGNAPQYWPIDPTLAASASPSISQPGGSSQPPPSTQPSKGKGRCASGRCGRVAGAGACSWKFCKGCCELQGKGCRYPGHRSSTATTPASTSAAVPSGDPSALARPAPMFAYDPTSSIPDPLDDSQASEKVYKKTMDPKWARQYNTNHEEREMRKAAEDQRRKQELMFERQVQVCCWMTNGGDPEWARQQGILTYPKLNMADYPSLLKKLGVTATDELYLYDFDGRCFRREDVDHVMQITTHQIILARHVGVTDCPRLDEYIGKYATKRPGPTSSSRRALPSTLKRKSDAAVFPPSLKTPRSSSLNVELPRPRSCPPSPSSSRPSSPSPSLPSSSRPSSPSPSVSPVQPVPLPNPAPNPHPPTPHATDDSLWASGRVFFPLIGKWPEGIYARDMATAFRMILPSSKTPIADRFQEVFQRPFPKGAWYQQVKAWNGCEQQERDAAMLLPRTHAGLWTEWRLNTTGWAKVCAAKKH